MMRSALKSLTIPVAARVALPTVLGHSHAPILALPLAAFYSTLENTRSVRKTGKFQCQISHLKSRIRPSGGKVTSRDLGTGKAQYHSSRRV